LVYAVAQIERGLEISFLDDQDESIPEVFSAICRNQAVLDMDKESYNWTQVVDNLSQCLEDAAASRFQEMNDEIAFENRVLSGMSNAMENFTCADPSKELSEPVETREWTHNDGASYDEDDVVTRKVLVMHDRPASQIHVLEDFITKEECDAITEAAKPHLHRGTVADGSGGHTLSDNRKAWQAGIRVQWEKERKRDPIARVVRRLYDYTNDAVGYNLTVEGQEDLMSIQYFGMGNNSTESPDQYRPHCDGDCTGLAHKEGGRVATMVMYCDVPDLGGATNFQKANVFVKPKLHAAVFFSYMDPITHKQETGFTTHSGCPVIEGTKRIAVHWMRIGVDKENPWDSFNTLTIKKSETG
jgi:2OG-Fe(II) oxygenase superfamily